MSENLVACEFEDSTNCVWNAQEQGNGIGESFVDVNGVAYYATEGLAVTGTGDVVVGLLLGLALLTAGVILFIRGRKNK